MQWQMQNLQFMLDHWMTVRRQLINAVDAWLNGDRGREETEVSADFYLGLFYWCHGPGRAILVCTILVCTGRLYHSCHHATDGGMQRRYQRCNLQQKKLPPPNCKSFENFVNLPLFDFFSSKDAVQNYGRQLLGMFYCGVQDWLVVLSKWLRAVLLIDYE